MPTFPKDDGGNVRVDFVWGTMPMQPDEGRNGTETATAPNDEGDRGWTGVVKKNSDTLIETITTGLSVGDQSYNAGWQEPSLRSVKVLNNHSLITHGYNNFPAYVPNYAGDGDASLETVMPNIIGLTNAEASAALTAAGLVPYRYTTYSGATVANDGKVKDAEIEAGVAVNPGITVEYYTYEAPTVPNVIGLTNSAAETSLINAGLILGDSTPDTAGATSGNNGKVKTQSVVAGTKVNAGTVVNLGIYNYVAPAGNPIAGISITAFPGHPTPAGGTVYMFLVGRTVKPTAGNTITISGNTNTSLNRNWTVNLVEDNDSYNSGGTVCTITAQGVGVVANPNINSGGTWVVA